MPTPPGGESYDRSRRPGDHIGGGRVPDRGHRPGDGARLDFAERRRRAGYPTDLPVDRRTWVLTNRDKVVDVADALGPEPDFPRLP